MTSDPMPSLPERPSGQPFQIHLTLDVDDATVQAAALSLAPGDRGPGDPDWDMRMTRAFDSTMARCAVLKASVEAGLHQLLPGADVDVWMVGPLPAAADE